MNFWIMATKWSDQDLEEKVKINIVFDMFFQWFLMALRNVIFGLLNHGFPSYGVSSHGVPSHGVPSNGGPSSRVTSGGSRARDPPLAFGVVCLWTLMLGTFI